MSSNLSLTYPEQLFPPRQTALSNPGVPIHRRYQTPSQSVRTLTMFDVSPPGNVQPKLFALNSPIT